MVDLYKLVITISCKEIFIFHLLYNIFLILITDRKCTGLKAIENRTKLEIEKYSCDEKKMAVCIEKSRK